MQTMNVRTAKITAADRMEMNGLGSALFAEWYRHYRPGDAVPAMPPLHIMREAQELALRHRMVAALRRGQRAT